MPHTNEILTVESSCDTSSLSSESQSPQPRTKHRHKHKKPKSNNQKTDILFDECHWYDIPCPHPQCYAKDVRFDSHQKFKIHHEQYHCPRGNNGDIDRAKDSLRWQCPVISTVIIDGKQVTQSCHKVSNSWYNYAGHITSHKEIGHGWGCALSPAGKRKKTNVKRSIYDPNQEKYVKLVVCGKRTSTKHHLLAHMSNVHKEFSVIDTNARQYNKKKSRKCARKSANKKRKFIDITEDDRDSHTSLLQMPLPQFNKIHTIPAMGIPQFPNLFNPLMGSHNLLPIYESNALPPPVKRMRLMPTSQGFQCTTNDASQFRFLSLLCKAVSAHKGCIKCDTCDDVEIDTVLESDTEMTPECETTAPSISTYSNVSPSTVHTNDDNHSTNSSALSLPKLPIIFPNFSSDKITANVPFTFDLNQLCTNSGNTKVISTAIPSLPTLSGFNIN